MIGIVISFSDRRLHRSNSMSTLPSLCREEANERLRCLNRSMHEDIDHNLTYSYSSSEDSLNESFSINFTPKKPRSAGAGLRTVASPLYATPTKARGNTWQKETSNAASNADFHKFLKPNIVLCQRINSSLIFR